MPPSPRFADHKDHARRLIAAALAAADPAAALARHWDPALAKNASLLLSVGKASVPMALEALERSGKMGPRLRQGLVTSPPEQASSWRARDWPIRVLACDHPFPTARNVDAAGEAANLVRSARTSDTLIVLISGGGSAHLTLPAAGLSVDDLAAVTRLLQRAGATISDLNCVRKHCEQLKGGRLAALSGAGHLVSYILSDVLGDKLDVISSGPTAPDPTTYSRALEVLARFGLRESVPAVTVHLQRGAAGEIDETPKPGDPAFARVTNTIIASNRIVVDAVADAARSLGFVIAGVEQAVEGEAADVGRALAAKAAALAPGSCWVLGGETTVTVGERAGVGGPSQELALAAAAALDGAPGVAMLTFSTDGRDGPTDAAGALVTGQTCTQARALGLDTAKALGDHDSHTLLDTLGALMRVPPTGTNLNHFAVLLRYADAPADHPPLAG
jgi:hydroxypyruvate reductase